MFLIQVPCFLSAHLKVNEPSPQGFVCALNKMLPKNVGFTSLQETPALPDSSRLDTLHEHKHVCSCFICSNFKCSLIFKLNGEKLIPLTKGTQFTIEPLKQALEISRRNDNHCIAYKMKYNQYCYNERAVSTSESS